MHLRSEVFRMRLTPEERERLDKLADIRSVSRAAVVRQLIRAAHEHAINGRPWCSTGSPCLVPHLHQRQAKAVVPMLGAADE